MIWSYLANPFQNIAFWCFMQGGVQIQNQRFWWINKKNVSITGPTLLKTNRHVFYTVTHRIVLSKYIGKHYRHHNQLCRTKHRHIYENLGIIKHCRKSLLYNNHEPWKKKDTESCSDVTMVSYDGAEICELVGIYLLSLLANIIDIINTDF